MIDLISKIGYDDVDFENPLDLITQGVTRITWSAPKSAIRTYNSQTILVLGTYVNTELDFACWFYLKLDSLEIIDGTGDRITVECDIYRQLTIISELTITEMPAGTNFINDGKNAYSTIELNSFAIPWNYGLMWNDNVKYFDDSSNRIMTSFTTTGRTYNFTGKKFIFLEV